VIVQLLLRVWWGSWTYYFDPTEAAEKGSINWYKSGPGKDAWHRLQLVATG